MAEVSIVTAARREVASAVEEQQGAAAGAVDVLLNPSAREFLPWWRLGSPVGKELSVNAPEFHASPSSKALSVDAPEFPASPSRTKALSVDAPEFLASPARKALSVDAPEFPASPSRKALSVDAPEFVASPVRKSLSVDAPEFVLTKADIGPAATAAVDADGGSNATPPPAGVFQTGTRAAHRPRRFLNRWQEAVQRTIFVKYIDHTVTEQVLAELFQSCGSRAAHRPRRFLNRWQEAVQRTIFVKYIDHTVTEQVLAELFQSCGSVVDCRICGDPSNGLRYGFVEFQHEEEAYAALFFDGFVIGISTLRVLPSRTAICPVNPKFLPQSEDEREICSRTIYCTNISKTVQSSDLKAYCETYFGKVFRIKLLENDKHSTNIAFIEFTEVDGATAALASTAIFAGGLRVRMCPSKTPIRGYCYGSWPVLAAGSSAETNNQPVNGGSTMMVSS